MHISRDKETVEAISVSTRNKDASHIEATVEISFKSGDTYEKEVTHSTNSSAWYEAVEPGKDVTAIRQDGKIIAVWLVA